MSRVLAGPCCAMVLGDLGAEVIKLEHPGRGDDTRDWGIKVGSTQTAYFNSMNRNKRSVTLDLQNADAQKIALDLVRKSDVIIHNFKHGGIEKFGLGYDQVKEVNPEIVYCSITGYDSTGPEASRPGYDLVVQGETGLMHINGEPHQPPLKFGIAAVDLMTGMYSAQAVLAALFQRQITGRGRHISMALYDCGLMISSYYGLEALLMQKDPPKYGNAHPSIVPYGVFDAKDGRLVITVGNNSQFERFCRDVINRPDLAEDDRFKTNLKRTENRSILLSEIQRELSLRTCRALLQNLAAVGIPCGEVVGLYDALTSERTEQGGLVVDFPHQEAGTVSVMAPPYRLDGVRMPVRYPPPPLGEATQDVLHDILELSDAEIARLKSVGAI
ncbi:CaiB/BaiF CoA transferase family protein [Ferribacterium limneticum]|uniref:CaiB/BaiF CoA transferase family protein n=1 Tax=Ferribacterium limneticum TaxID=76259 RepID=UPI00384DA9B4|nr:CoA transferase [Ferribacterium limneticum]